MRKKNERRPCALMCKAVFIFIAEFWHKAGEGVLNLSFFIRYVKFLTAKNLM